MTQASSEDSSERVHRALDAAFFKRHGISPNSKRAKNYSKMMRKPLTQEEWLAHQQKLKDPKYAAVWLDRVLSGWHRKNPSLGSKRHSKK